MQLHQHRFDSVEDYLHHRPPYLMVDEIVSIGADEILTEKLFTGDELFAPGHFPGASIMPGAMMQELTTQSAGILIAANYNPMAEFNTEDPFFNEFALGVLVRVTGAKYRGFARPGDRLQARVMLSDYTHSLFDFSASITVNGKPIMENAFRLANIKSSLLQGEQQPA